MKKKNPNRTEIIEAIKFYELRPYKNLVGVSVRPFNVKIYQERNLAVADINILMNGVAHVLETDVEYPISTLMEIKARNEFKEKAHEQPTETSGEENSTTSAEPKSA